MATSIELFDYDLPKECIAQAPVAPRDHSKLMMLDHGSGQIIHKHFFDLPEFLRAGDVLVFNNTKVFKARLHTQDGVEVFLLRERDGLWEALARPGKKLQVGCQIGPIGTIDFIRVVEKRVDGTVLIDFGVPKEEVMKLCEEFGEAPIPPYVVKSEVATKNYQTVYAKEFGAVAAPTAGFHFTERLLAELSAKGIQQEFITLHVGVGTFRPVKTATLEEHEMHAEHVAVSPETSLRLLQAKQEGRRVIAVGTTVVRTLEATRARPYSGDVNIFIMPGYTFCVVDGLITNFHLPKSTLLALVSAFAGRDATMRAYESAKQNEYRFYSFGDAMLIL